jgi:hypothetical protein
MPHRGRLLVNLGTRKSFLVLFFKKEGKEKFLLFEKRSKNFARLGVGGLAGRRCGCVRPMTACYEGR